ncbi:MAG: DUF3857 and transglutaminase domain-containing protein, partial [Acetobacteraceae bacterium]|nr:DUF3857 and transglutaminase domain-containing protein [Acetobacteraceae bacterium]
MVARVVVGTALLLLSAATATPAAAAAPPLVIVAADNAYEVQADGSYVQTYRFVFRPTNDASARQEAQQAITYNPALEDFAILEAHTQKPDGRTIAVPPDAVHDALPPADPDLTSFGESRQKIILFPDVAGGDTLSYTWRRTVKHPLFPGQFMTSIFMASGTPWLALDLTVTAPAATKLQTEWHGFDYDEHQNGERTVRHWHGSDPGGSGRQAAVGPYDRLPRVFVSTFPDYDSFAAAYARLVAAKAEPTPTLRGLADTLTAGVTDRREQARLLYDYVSLHVRYAAVYLSNGALEPRPAEQVLADGYGDCKDHTVLFNALLAAKGIAAELVMVNIGAHYTLSGPPTFAQLNHAISYLPEGDLYADTTPRTAPFGTLQFEEYGKPVVHAVSDGHAVRRIPALAADAALLHLQTDATLRADGSIVGDTVTEARGPFSAELRGRALWAEATGAGSAAVIQLRSLGAEGVGDLAWAPPERLAPGYEMSGHFVLEPQPGILDGDSFAPPVGLRVSSRTGDRLLGPLAWRTLAD